MKARCADRVGPNATFGPPKVLLVSLRAARVWRRCLRWMRSPSKIERGDPGVGFPQPFSVESVSSMVEAERKLARARTVMGVPGLTSHVAEHIDPVRLRGAAIGSQPERPALPKIALVSVLGYGATACRESLISETVNV